ncbi:MAG: hydrogenase expression/formation protein HypE [Thermoanaerobaculales bacterium]|nr:hydrogenase expression/formation protein HypE [Thermoanaerobaculales bacterium]
MSRRRDKILLAHGAGGRLTGELIANTFLPALANPHLEILSDAAVLPELPPGRPALTTDAFVVDPPVFAGGDVGRLSVCGTVNDLAMVGATPLWLTWALILEEGTDMGLVEQCTESAAEAAREAGVTIVAGDTKVVARGSGDKIFAITSGLGVVPPGRDIGDHRIRPGDAILASGTLGDHGATIMAARHALESATLRSDAAPVNALVKSLFDAAIDVHSLHDPTRGGLKSVANEVAVRGKVRLVLEEDAIPVRPEATTVCELLGLDPFGLACEGRFLAWVAQSDADAAVAALRNAPGGEDAAVIGRIEDARPGMAPVVLEARSGGTRPLDLLSGADLPRIC